MSDLASFEAMGGKPELVKINKVFYDKVYAHPWLKRYFTPVTQERIEHQQVNFMQRVLGGKNEYIGKTPPMAHRHMFISEELFEVRQALLVEAFEEVGAPLAMREKWLNFDNILKAQIVRKSPQECTPRLSTEGVINHLKP
jgi:hemoglobin